MAKKIQIDRKILHTKASALFRMLDESRTRFTNGAIIVEDFKAMKLSLHAVNDFLKGVLPEGDQRAQPLQSLELGLDDLFRDENLPRLKFRSSRNNLGNPIELEGSWIFAAVLIALKDEEVPGNYLGRCKEVAKIFTKRGLTLPGRKNETSAKRLLNFCTNRLGEDAEMKQMYIRLMDTAHKAVPVGTTPAKQFESVFLAYLETDILARP